MNSYQSWPSAATAVDLVIEARSHELTEGFKVRRVLPHVKRRMVGPFIFLDEMGPEILTGEKALDVAPHPHIGLATVTYLFAGEILHRDGLGTRQIIRPGEVNWMTAGRGIAHSERTPPEMRGAGAELFGIQTWVALPRLHEECEPSFAHYGADELPTIEGGGTAVRLIAGSLFDARSPVETYSGMFYADVTMIEGASVQMPAEHEERAVYVVQGSVNIVPAGEPLYAGQLVILKPEDEIAIRANSPSVRLMLLGGEPMPERRHIWWNFVSSSRERIEEAKSDWKNGRFAPVPDETELIPLPSDTRPVVVRYP